MEYVDVVLLYIDKALSFFVSLLTPEFIASISVIMPIISLISAPINLIAKNANAVAYEYSSRESSTGEKHFSSKGATTNKITWLDSLSTAASVIVFLSAFIPYLNNFAHILMLLSVAGFLVALFALFDAIKNIFLCRDILDNESIVLIIISVLSNVLVSFSCLHNACKLFIDLGNY